VALRSRADAGGVVVREKRGIPDGGPDGAAYPAWEGGGPGGGAYSSGILIELVRCPVCFGSMGLELGS
jgi:hypothetical protein